MHSKGSKGPTFVFPAQGQGARGGGSRRRTGREDDLDEWEEGVERELDGGGGEVRAGESKEGEEREGGRERVARLRQRNKLTVLGRSQKRRLNVR